MPAKPPAIPSVLARRDAARHRLAGAVDCRDAQAVVTFTGQWVHRQGMASLQPLMAELAQGEALLWWQALLQQPIESVGLGPLQGQAGSPAAQGKPALADRTAEIEKAAIEASEPPAPEQRPPGIHAIENDLAPNLPGSAPAPGTTTDHKGIPTTASSDAEISQSEYGKAEITESEFQATESEEIKLQAPESEEIQCQAAQFSAAPIAESELPGTLISESDNPDCEIQALGIKGDAAIGDAATEAMAPTPTAAETPTPPAGSALITMPPAPRPAVAQVRRGPGSNRPAPAPRNPELARLRAWLPISDAQGGPSSRSHAA